MHLHYGDLTDSTCLVKIISEVKPDEIYNLGAQSHVKVCEIKVPPQTINRQTHKGKQLYVEMEVSPHQPPLANCHGNLNWCCME